MPRLKLKWYFRSLRKEFGVLHRLMMARKRFLEKFGTRWLSKRRCRQQEPHTETSISSLSGVAQLKERVQTSLTAWLEKVWIYLYSMRQPRLKRRLGKCIYDRLFLTAKGLLFSLQRPKALIGYMTYTYLGKRMKCGTRSIVRVMKIIMLTLMVIGIPIYLRLSEIWQKKYMIKNMVRSLLPLQVGYTPLIGILIWVIFLTILICLLFVV